MERVVDTSSEVPWFAPGTYRQRVAFPPPSARPLVLYFSRHARVAPASTGRGTHARRGSRPPAGGRTADEALEALGPLPVRASMGDGAGGLLGGRRLLGENRRRGKDQPEFELVDTGVLDGDRYFDVGVEYAKASPEDVLIRITVANRGAERAAIHVLPTLWFRNAWDWGRSGETFPP